MINAQSGERSEPIRYFTWAVAMLTLFVYAQHGVNEWGESPLQEGQRLNNILLLNVNDYTRNTASAE